MISQIDGNWLTAPDTVQVMSALDSARPGASRFVGGCVRNSIMQRPVSDVDIATQLLPDATMDALGAAGIRAIPTGIEHGTITAVIDHKPFEITTLRRDVETDGRRAVVAFTDDWAEDAQRRDFRLNALYADMDGQVFAPIPNALEDALQGRIIFIGDADERLREDYLRILRFFRFNAWYGAKIDEAGLKACERQKEGLSKIARERIWKEFKKTLAAPNPAQAIWLMSKTGILRQVTGFVSTTEALANLAPIDSDPMRRLMTLVPRLSSDIADLSRTLRLSKIETDRLADWAQADLPNVANASDAAFVSALYWHGSQAVQDRYIVASAVLNTIPDPALLDRISSWKRPSFPLAGADALRTGLKGADIGRALRKAEEAWVDSNFIMLRADLLKLMTA